MICRLVLEAGKNYKQHLHYNTLGRERPLWRAVKLSFVLKGDLCGSPCATPGDHPELQVEVNSLPLSHLEPRY